MNIVLLVFVRSDCVFGAMRSHGLNRYEKFVERPIASVVRIRYRMLVLKFIAIGVHLPKSRFHVNRISFHFGYHLVVNRLPHR